MEKQLSGWDFSMKNSPEMCLNRGIFKIQLIYHAVYTCFIQSGSLHNWMLTPLIHFDINYLFNKRLLSSFRHFVNFYKNKLCLGHKIMIYKLGGLFPETDTNSNGMVQGYQNVTFLKCLKLKNSKLKKSKIIFKLTFVCLL